MARHLGSQDRPPMTPSAGWALSPKEPIAKEPLMYEKPVVQRLGSLRELTLGLGPSLGGDPQSVYHRS